MTFTATVSPAPDAGTVAFTDGGTAIPGCSAIAVSAGGQARCPATYAVASRHAIAAVYLGDSLYGASGGALTQVVTAIAPAIAHLRARTIHRKLRLGLTISRSGEADRNDLPARAWQDLEATLPGRGEARRKVRRAGPQGEADAGRQARDEHVPAADAGAGAGPLRGRRARRDARRRALEDLPHHVRGSRAQPLKPPREQPLHTPLPEE